MRFPQSRASVMSSCQTMAISKPSGGVTAGGGVAAGIGATPRSARAVAQGLGGKGRAYKGTGEGGCAVLGSVPA